jgi:hypothetical protein
MKDDHVIFYCAMCNTRFVAVEVKKYEEAVALLREKGWQYTEAIREVRCPRHTKEIRDAEISDYTNTSVQSGIERKEGSG